MIISCKKCNKKFEVNSDLIPDEGRQLQCSSCNYEWFFREKSIANTDKKDDSNTSITSEDTFRVKRDELNIKNNLVNDNFLFEESVKKKNSKKNIKKFTKINVNKNKEKKISILNLIIVFIISFIALIILLDTFKTPISSVIPNIEFILFNLYETFKDIILFFKDLL